MAERYSRDTRLDRRTLERIERQDREIWTHDYDRYSLHRSVKYGGTRSLQNVGLKATIERSRLLIDRGQYGDGIHSILVNELTYRMYLYPVR